MLQILANAVAVIAALGMVAGKIEHAADPVLPAPFEEIQ